MKKIILTGGGTAGHVTPNLALLPALKAEGFEVHYIGSKNGLECDLVKAAGIPYHAISAGKLRRYVNLKNITDIFRVIKGLGDAIGVIRRIKPDIIFSKGGFVTVPVLVAARILRVPSITHESDITPGLANRLSQPFVNKICVSFPETLTHLPERKSVLTGTPIRQELLAGNKQKGLKLCNWPTTSDKPVIMITGGSQGAAAINACVREALPMLTPKFKIIHLCGKGNLSGINSPDYAEFEYVQEGLADLFALADVVISRAGANTLFELLALKMPNLLIPLTKEASRGDQILNAESFALQGFSRILPESNMTPERLLNDLELLYNEREIFIANMNALKQADGITQIMDVLRNNLP
ncbi:MAG: undecaprenyldiphospho-muramoylpentapeptide beta-N-acetylglucosaminyltransferase [Defluviitaleaceae bacterium]|nr:undecaprenyldiphospho-muramoylpentapeptide beta-N-acetylglucosaminyltransferase [Defluviitaleaceae bacterium]